MNNHPEAVTAEQTAEQTASQPAEAETALFAYDEEYARARKTYGQPYHKYIGLFAFVLAGCAFFFLGQQFVPKESAFADVPLYLGFLCWFIGIFVYPKLPNYKLSAWFRSFYAADGKLYAFRFTPYKDSRSNIRQSRYNASCFEACHDESLIFSLLDDYKLDIPLKKGERYRRVSVIPMENVQIIKKAKKSILSYTDKNGKVRKMTVADCYPGLFEHIEAAGK